jgi:hypothetical protein
MGLSIAMPVVVLAIVCGLVAFGLRKRRTQAVVRLSSPPVATPSRALATPASSSISYVYESPVALNPMYSSGSVHRARTNSVDVVESPYGTNADYADVTHGAIYSTNAKHENVSPGALYSANSPPTRRQPYAKSAKSVLDSQGGTVWEIPLETDEDVPVAPRPRRLSVDAEEYISVAGLGRHLTHKHEYIDVGSREGTRA